uniref:SH3 domain-containing protein n=1 Tax=Caenorhabditis japonica TaxID=281687 RepID=A0A8R1I078_CAEJA
MQDSSNTLLSYTQKEIDFFEKLGSFSKEKAAIEEEYSAKLRNLAKKYAKKADEENEIWKSVGYVAAFNSILHQIDQIAARFHSSAESIREDVVPYVTSKTVQLRSSRKNAINDLRTTNDRVEEQINEMCKAGKAYVKSYKDAETAYQKFYKADKNLEISRLELEKARSHAVSRNEICEKAKSEYSNAVNSTNAQQNKYYEEQLPVIFSRLKAVDKECIGDVAHVLQKLLTIEDVQADSVANYRSKMQSIVDKIDAEADAQLVLESVEATIERPPQIECEDFGDPKDENRSTDSHDGRANIEVAFSAYQLRSPGKKQAIRNFLGIREKEHESGRKTESIKELYADKDKPTHVRLSCLKTKIREMEKQLDSAIQGREGITRLQQAYYENPQCGNPAACTEPLISYAKKIEALKTNISKLKEFYTLLEMGLEGTPTERSSGGRDTPDTTRSMSEFSTNLSSSKTIEEILFTSSSSASTPAGNTEDHAKKMLRQLMSTPRRLISSPKNTKSPKMPNLMTPMRRKNEISSPVLRSSFSGVIHKVSAPSPLRCVSSPIRIEQSTSSGIGGEEAMQIVTAMFEFMKTTAETMTIVPGDELVVQEVDNGDGWTRAINKKNQEIGFVPTSYLQFTAIPSPITPP